MPGFNSNFTIYTINLLGVESKANETFLNKRIDFFINYLGFYRPDVACLQEVSYSIWSKLCKFAKKHSYFLEPSSYNWLDSPRDHLITAALLKYKPFYSVLLPLPHPSLNLDYHCLVVKLSNNIYVLNVHLYHGFANYKIRDLQLNYLKDYIESSNIRPLILVGDFNFDLDDNSSTNKLFVEQTMLLKNVWNILNPGVRGFTQDPDTNTLRRQINSTTHKRRIDGFFCSNTGITPKYASLIANEGIPNDKYLYNQLFVSDHYGVMCIFQI